MKSLLRNRVSICMILGIFVLISTAGCDIFTVNNPNSVLASQLNQPGKNWRTEQFSGRGDISGIQRSLLGRGGAC